MQNVWKYINVVTIALKNRSVSLTARS